MVELVVLTQNWPSSLKLRGQEFSSENLSSKTREISGRDRKKRTSLIGTINQIFIFSPSIWVAFGRSWGCSRGEEESITLYEYVRYHLGITVR